MIRLMVAAIAGLGVHLVFTSIVFGRSRLSFPALGSSEATVRPQLRTWLAQAGLDEVSPTEFVAAELVLVLLGGTGGFVVFGGILPAIATGAFAASWPVATFRRRRTTRMAKAQESWPRMIEEIRIMTGALGRSVPNALFEVGRRGPAELASSFAAAEREWHISTDFPKTLQVLKDRLADPTADATCETLLIAHELGGTELDSRLSALAQDRIQDTQGRKDARSKQAGVRFARRFVLVVPLAMAVAGMSLGTGRSAYQAPTGQFLVLLALGLTVACWVWSGRIMRMPDQERVFSR